MEHDVVAAPMPPSILKDLGLPSSPDFLSFYRPAKETPETLYQRAFHLNHIKECQRAISVLEPLYRVKPEQPGVAFELAYAYNSTRHADLALPVLEAGCRKDSPDRLLLRELAYTYLHSSRFKEAVATYLRCLPLVPESDGVERSEEALNLAFAYGGLKDETNRQEWLAKAKGWAPKGSAVEDFFTRQVK
jgi:tetratricopeptide (TPR) repeat protein